MGTVIRKGGKDIGGGARGFIVIRGVVFRFLTEFEYQSF